MNNNDELKLFPPAEVRAYRLAVTDLFVEKAQAYLEIRAQEHRKLGIKLGGVGVVVLLLGVAISFYFLQEHSVVKEPEDLIYRFSKAFTAYGMLVLVAVKCFSYSKAMLDQAERLYTKRHALRQGRLYVHLNDGCLSMKEMEDAFKWNEHQTNAFTDFNAEAQAPWGIVAKELVKTAPDLIKASLEVAKKSSDSVAEKLSKSEKK